MTHSIFDSTKKQLCVLFFLLSSQENCGSCGLFNFTRTSCRIREEVQVEPSSFLQMIVMVVRRFRGPLSPSQGLLLAQRHSCRDAASSGQKHPHEDTSGCQDQPPRHHARYARPFPPESVPNSGPSPGFGDSSQISSLTAVFCFFWLPQMS